MKFHEGFDANHITGDIDLVVYSTAYNEKNNEELKAAKYKMIPMISYPEMLGLLVQSKIRHCCFGNARKNDHHGDARGNFQSGRT